MKLENIRGALLAMLDLRASATTRQTAVYDLALFLARQEQRLTELERLASITVAQPGPDLTEGRVALAASSPTLDAIALEAFQNASPYDTVGQVRAKIRKRIQEL